MTSEISEPQQRTLQLEDGANFSRSRTASPSPSCHDEESLDGVPRYAPPSILPRDYNVPSSIDHTSSFFHVLTAPYHPPASLASLKPWLRTTPRQKDKQRCAAMVEWGDTGEDSTASVPQEGSSTSSRELKDIPIYVPHGPWAWAAGEDIHQVETLLSLRQGSMCSAYIQTGVIGGRKINFISRRWNLDKQAEWIGFNSEMALYSSEQYLKPLQGVVVPRIIGVHIFPGAVSIAMELPHQSFWMEASPNMPYLLKKRAMEGLEMLHSRGILHGDIELRHVLIGGDGAVTFIDFQLSRSATPDDSIGLEKAEDEEFRFEKRLLAFKLDFEDARAREIQKTEAFVKRTRRNKRREEMWKHRSNGIDTGYISPYEDEPEDEKIIPPVHPHDLQDVWIKNSDVPLTRIVVPGQSEEEVKTTIQVFLQLLAEPRPDQGLSQSLPSIEGMEEESGSVAIPTQGGQEWLGTRSGQEPSTSSIISASSIDPSSSTIQKPASPLKRKRSTAPSPSPHASLASFDTPPVKRIRRETEPSSSALPALPWTNPRDRVHMWYSDLPEDAEVPTPPVRVKPLSDTAARIREENIALCREEGLPHPALVETGEVIPSDSHRIRLLLRKRRGVARGNLLRDRDRDGYSQYVHHIEKSHQRERYLSLKHLKNAYIATCAGASNLSGMPMKEGDRTLVALLHMNERKDIPEGPRILQQAEYEHIQNARKQAVILAPSRKLLKRGREDDTSLSFLPSENSLNPSVPVATTSSATSSTIPPPRKKARMTTSRPSKATSTLLPKSSRTSNQRTNVRPPHPPRLVERHSHVYPESGVDFTPPSWRGLSLWMGSLMSWSH